MLARIITALLLSLALSPLLLGQSDCSAVLLQRNIDQAQRDEATLRRWLSVVSESNFESAKKSAEGKAMYGAFFASGSYSDFAEKRREYFNRVQWSEDHRESESHLRVTLPPDAVAAWLACQRLRAGSDALSLVVVDVDEEAATVEVSWNPPAGLGDLVIDDSTAAGSTLPTGLTEGRRIKKGTLAYSLARSSPTATIRLAINGLAGQDGRYSARAFIPAPPKPPAQFRKVYLSDLTPSRVTNIHGGLQRDRVYWQDQVWMGGNQYSKALGLHAPASGVGSVEYVVPTGATWFRAEAGLARQDTASGCSGAFSVRVLLNDTEVLQRSFSGTTDRAPIKIAAYVAAGLPLRIEVNAGGDNGCDHFTLGDPIFE